MVKGQGRLEVIEDEAALVRQVFTMYTVDRLGSHAIAKALNDAGHRQRGRLFSYKMILDLLRCRLYLGEVHFRDQWYRGTTKASSSPRCSQKPDVC